MGISRVTPLGCLVALCACAWALGCGAPEPTGGRALDDAGQEDTGGDGADASADTGVGADADVDQGPSCGDGACGVGEDASSCAVDCARCGDEVCSEGEDIGSCEQDCWAPEDDLVLAFTLDADREVRILTGTEGTFEFDVDWDEDGVFDDLDQTGDVSHTYEGVEDTRIVRIRGRLPWMLFDGIDGTCTLAQVRQWGQVRLESMRRTFSRCARLRSLPDEAPDLSNVQDMREVFLDAAVFDDDVSGWDTSSVTDMSGMFRGAVAFDQDLSGWDTSSVTDMSSMFRDAAAFDQAIGAWDTSAVTNTSFMFAGAVAFDQDPSGWDTGAVEGMGGMFSGAAAFDRPIGSWDTSSVTNTSFMFKDAIAFDQDLSGWDTSSVTDMSNMFVLATSFDKSLGSWDIGAVDNMSRMLFNSGMSSASYDATLIGWSSGSSVPRDLALNARGLRYCSDEATAARDALIDTYGWTIIDNGRCL